MKAPLHERFADFIVGLIRPIIVFLMERELKVTHFGDKITKDREPFILISNHFNTWDAFALMKHNKTRIRFVVTEIAFLDKSKKALLKYIARAIRKRVGKKDVKATKEIFRYLKMGYSIGVFPEGDNTYYGETLEIFQNTGRLLKKTNVDVVLTKQALGYISQPRWADYFSKSGQLHTYTKTIITKEELKELEPDQITKIVEKELYHNDYDYQREHMIPMKRKKRAEGIERLIYYCNKCNSVMTIYGEDSHINCSTCGTIGTINEFEFIEGNKHDNLVDYNKEQYSHIEEVIHSEFSFPVTLNVVNTKKLKNKKVGKYTLYYKDKKITLKNNKETRVFDLKDIKHQVNTMRHSFSFDYKEVTYNFTDIKHQFVLFEMCRYLNGSYK